MAVKKNDGAISQADFQHMLREVVVLVLPRIIAKDVWLALSDEKVADMAREGLYNRLVGRPVEQVKQSGSISNSFNLLPIKSLKGIKVLPGRLVDGRYKA